jgi:predicted esterase
MRRLSLLLLLLSLALAGCPADDDDSAAADDDDDVAVDDDDSAATDDDDSASADDDDSASDDDDSASDDDDDVVPLVGRCGDPRPDGAPFPPPMPLYSEGACPALVVGANTLISGGLNREFLLVVPADYDPDTEVLPLQVMWHFLGGSDDLMLEHGQVQQAVDELRFIAAIPDKTGDLLVDLGSFEFDPAWPYLSFHTEELMAAEAVFFDDMIACVAEQHAIDEDCISTVGVSAGALWASQLLQRRAERLASAVILSGGVGPATSNPDVDVQGWTGASRPLPALVGWGGPTDFFLMDFEVASNNLEAELEAAGHFVMECIHNCGHAVPPVDTAAGLGVLYSFALDHPWWVTGGHSVYTADGMPEGTPDWCALGAGHAVIREGDCEPM